MGVYALAPFKLDYLTECTRKSLWKSEPVHNAIDSAFRGKLAAKTCDVNTVLITLVVDVSSDPIQSAVFDL